MDGARRAEQSPSRERTGILPGLTSDRACGQFAVALLTIGIVAMASGTVRAEVPGTIVLVGDVPSDGLVEAARQEMPATWRVGRIAPAAAAKSAPPSEIDSLAQAYMEADFLRCLTRLQSATIDIDHLLEQLRRDEAARVATFAGACALGAGDRTRSRELVRRMFVRQLDDAETLRRTTPEFQSLVDEERGLLRQAKRIVVEILTTPERSEVYVDGVLRCRSSPCHARVVVGDHIVVATSLGRRPRAISVELDEPQQLTLALDEGAANDVRRQLAAELAEGSDPTRLEVSQAAATAFGAPVLVMVWKDRATVHATAYERGVDRILAHVAIDAGPDSTVSAVRAAVHETQGVTRPRPLVKQPLFWLTVAGVAVLTGTIVLFATRPVEIEHQIVFP